MEENLDKNIYIKHLDDETLNNISSGYGANSVNVFYNCFDGCYYAKAWKESIKKNVLVRVPNDLAKQFVDLNKKVINIVGDPYDYFPHIDWDLAGKYKEATGKDIVDMIRSYPKE